MTTSAVRHPVRVGIFDSVQQVERTVAKLLDGGFTKDELAVVCSEPTAADHFLDEGLKDENPANAPARAAAGGVIGTLLGGVAAIGLVTTGGLGVVAAGFLVPAMISGGIAGGFLGAMTTRGVDSEAADFYNQVVEKGKFLVVVEDRTGRRLRKAAEILSRSGAIPVPLTQKSNTA